MRSQLSFIGRVVCSLYVLLLFGHSVSFAAEKYDLKGTVKGIDGKVTVELAGTKKDDKTNRNGEFKLNNVLEGEYTLQVIADKKVIHEQSIKVDSDDDNLEINVGSSSAVVDKTVVSAAAANSANQEVSSVPAPQTAEASGGASNDFILNELNFEIKKLTAEFKHLSREMDDLKALSKMWINPLTIYSKEIILKNGSTVFGKIVYQDEETLKVETLVGFLVIDRSNVVRIIENVMAQEDQEYVPEQIRESYSPPPMPKLAEPRYVSDSSSNRVSSRERAANIVLVGNIAEKKDKSNNVTFTGQVKNVGGQRADFVKVNFVLRKNWSGETRTLTSFVGGSYYTFDSGITTDSSLLPGASGEFELIVPSDIGSFLGYSYTIDWEEYE